jgi:hypothetical protein
VPQKLISVALRGYGWVDLVYQCVIKQFYL